MKRFLTGLFLALTAVSCASALPTEPMAGRHAQHVCRAPNVVNVTPKPPAQWYVVASAVNSAAIATFAAVPNKKHYVVGVDISASDAPANPVSVTLVNGAATMTQLELPVGKFAPLMHNYQRPWEGGTNQAMVLTLPALGVGIRGTVVLRGFTAMA